MAKKKSRKNLRDFRSKTIIKSCWEETVNDP